MLLVVDVGNTDIVFGFYEDKTWKAVLRTPTHQPWSANGVVNWIKKEWASKELGETLPSLALISSVVPSISPQIQRGLALWLGYSPVMMRPKLYETLEIQVIVPEEI
jgi:type III pantothenate kinase